MPLRFFLNIPCIDNNHEKNQQALEYYFYSIFSLRGALRVHCMKRTSTLTDTPQWGSGKQYILNSVRKMVPSVCTF